MSQKKKIKLSDLDFNNIGGWPQQAKIVFCVLLAAFIWNRLTREASRRSCNGRPSGAA